MKAQLQQHQQSDGQPADGGQRKMGDCKLTACVKSRGRLPATLDVAIKL
jgi:hypothetical protein